LEDLDGGAKFKYDSWIRDNGGGGVSAVLANGKVFEKAGVAVSVVYGTMPEEALKAANDRGFDRARKLNPSNKNKNGQVQFFACGISSVLHPRNPHAPTMHFNYRFFETEHGLWWFGGGADITPSYIDKADMRHFHGTLKTVCDQHDTSFYPKFKKWADEYFVIAHRNETRGLGGIFFDDLNDRDPHELVDFAKDCLDAIVPAYAPIVARHKDDRFSAEEKRWQQLRRGRYTEFNLIYDRGTIFGLKTGGRVESILMTIPETARWEYMHEPAPGSREADIMDAFKHPREWV
jgi:coproporphyrinogen III oxidase